MKIIEYKYKKIITLVVVSIVIFVPILYLFILCYNALYPMRFMKRLYYSQTQHFNNIVSYLHDIYQEDIESVYIYLKDDGTLTIEYNNSFKRIDISQENVYSSFNVISEHLILEYSRYPMGISAYYDYDGNIELMICCYQEKSNGDGMNTSDLIKYYLVYIDDEYSGKSHFSIEYRKPFTGNWYTWSKSAYSG